MTWDEYFFGIIKDIAKKSKDPSTQVGCIIVSPDNETIVTGFNGFPRRVEDRPEIVPERYEQRELKLLFTEHSERNAIYTAARRGISLDGCKIYVEWHPCADCMRAIIQVGIKEIVLNGNSESFNNPELRKRWETHFICGDAMAAEASIKIRIWH
jgi:dCMP deaminase